MARTQITRTCPVCGNSFTRRLRGNGSQQTHCSKLCAKTSYSRQVTLLFWSRVDKHGPIPPHRPDLDPCWIWKDHRNASGYGSTQKQLAHRMAWMLTHGPIPESLCVLHACDNPPCVNPAHLSLGTHLENMTDALRKGRMAASFYRYTAKPRPPRRLARRHTTRS